MMTEVAPDLLTEAQWQIAHAIAHDLVEAGTGVSELRKAIAYLNSAMSRDLSKAGTQFFKFLKTLVSNGRKIGHSSRTIDYYRNLDKVCNAHLRSEEPDAQSMLQVLNWTARLILYYKVLPIGEDSFNTQPGEVMAVAKRQTAVAKLKTTQVLEVGQLIEAQVVTKHSKGNKVTYLIAGISSTEKEPKVFDLIPENGTVKVQIISLKDDGSINHVKFLSS
jgi:hypothetical protein